MKMKQGKKSYAVFGLGEFGRSVALELVAAGADVLAIDIDENLIADIAPKVTLAVQLDASEIRSLDSLGLSNMDGVIVAMTSCLEACIMTIMAAKNAGVSFILAKSQSSTQTAIFEQFGVNRIVMPEYDGGIRVARNLISGNFLDFFELSKSIRMVEVQVKQEWTGKSLKELSLRQKYKLNVIALRRHGELSTELNPDAPFVEGDHILATVDKRYIEELAD